MVPRVERSSVLLAPLPARWGLLQRLKNTAIYLVVRTSFAVLALLPFAIVARLCTLLGWLAARIAVKERRLAEEHLAIALGEITLSERRRLANAMFSHFAASLAELTHLRRFIDGPQAVRLSEGQRAVLDTAFAEGKGVVAVTGHIGNWELLAQVIARAGYPVTSIAKPLYDPRLTRFVHRARTAYGMSLVWRGDERAGKDMLRVFKSAGMLALLIDQDTKVQGAFVPFFGRLAHTPTAAASLALRFDAPIVLAWIHRVGRKHVLHVERLPLPESKGDDTVLAVTAELNRRLEAAIRLHPEQWVWLHRRWKKQPPTTVQAG